VTWSGAPRLTDAEALDLEPVEQPDWRVETPSGFTHLHEQERVASRLDELDAAGRLDVGVDVPAEHGHRFDG
jgi:hypothetical protein